MRRGELVSDEVVIGMVQERLAEISGGVILDGFPRTVRQAQALDRISVGRSDDDGSRLIAFELEVPREELLRRLTGRRVCRAAGHVYHLEFNPPRAEGVCDVDGSALYQRDDDSAATAARRLAVYEEETAPVLGYYERSGRLARIDGTGSREGVQAAVLAALPPVAEPS
jgi:adenylate kinase